jgi:hypothetical protein
MRFARHPLYGSRKTVKPFGLKVNTLPSMDPTYALFPVLLAEKPA